MAKTLLCCFCLSEVDARHTSGLFTIQGELENLPSFLGRIFLVAVMKDDGPPVFVRPSAQFLVSDHTEGVQYGLFERNFFPGTHHHYVWRSNDIRSWNTETYTVASKFPRKSWVAVHAQTVYTRCSLQFFEHFGTRLSMYPTLLDVIFEYLP